MSGTGGPGQSATPPGIAPPIPPSTVPDTEISSFFLKKMKKFMDITTKRDIYNIVTPQKSGKKP
jgi:hypothetical protein